MEKIKQLHYQEHVLNGLSYAKIQEKHNITRGKWTYYVAKYNLTTDRRHTRPNDTYFDVLDSADKCYILGFLYADGCITNDDRISILLSIKDLEVLEFIQSNLSPQNKIDTTNYQDKNFKRSKQIRFRFKSKYMVKRLKKLGFTTDKTKVDSNIFKHVPNKFKLDFIRGYCDGDGSVRCDKVKSWRNTSVSFSNGSKKILKDIALYFNTYDLKGEKLKAYKNKSKFYTLSYYRKKEVHKICSLLYDNDNYALSRKKEKAKCIIAYNNTEVTKESKKPLEP